MVRVYPQELKPRTLSLPPTDAHDIVVITGPALRHQRFALRIISEFGPQVRAWYQLTRPSTASSSRLQRFKKQVLGSQGGARAFWDKALTYTQAVGATEAYRRASLMVRDRYYLRQRVKRISAAEQRMFGREIERMKGTSHLEPQLVSPMDVNSADFVQELQAIAPYFLLTLGGPLYRRPLLRAARGAAINQHAGHSPMLRGSYTAEWALYHRNLDYVSNTVHITTSGADAGPILRRSHPCLFPKDTQEEVFARVVALGTELLIESVRDIIDNKEVTVFDQPPESGRTRLASEYNATVYQQVEHDFRNRWLEDELKRVRQF